MLYNLDNIPETMKKPISDWLVEYKKILDSYIIGDKTRENRNNLINFIDLKLGKYPIGLIKPYEIAAILKSSPELSPSKTKRVLIEIKNMFKEAVIYDWIDKNPATYLKSPKTIVQRQRLSFEDWQAMYHYSRLNSPEWVPILLLLALVTGQRRSDLAKMKYADVVDGNLLVTQAKTGIKIAIPIHLKLEAIDMSLKDVIEESKDHYKAGEFILRKHNGQPPGLAALSVAAETCVRAVLPKKNTSLHECRSLAERLYRRQGIDTRLLLGHKHQSMTDVYNNERGLNSEQYTVIPVKQPIPKFIPKQT